MQFFPSLKLVCKRMRSIESDKKMDLIRTHAHKLRLKHIYRKDPLMRNKKLTWLFLKRGCDWL